ncbi:phage holin family protein [Proteus terrae]|uniref:phage holin family protein n=1 Tax=Proteus terrae TaxID=1574161 RepID=UPI0018C77250|nr:phage holin family protein [Proteus terrae]MBG2838649.1 phage holin family protein [Proteus terrae subsp. cibarius]MBG2870338.1 phage holin family protein [Proteus terrae subsp. cibarius]MBJ2109577.1 phage holin family protein [Proteus terrae]MBJ2133521.1 phage holin family protein [Proteus terrae]MCS6714953.1 phage holin family protein [Proteus terrae]
MDEYNSTLISLVIVGAFIALGKMLVANETITLRLFIGKIILGSAVSVVAGALLILWPGIDPVAVMGIGSALGIVGYQLVEIWLRKRGNQFFSGKGKDDTK